MANVTAHGASDIAARLPPGPSAHRYLLTWRWMREPFEFMEECAARYGDVFSFSLAVFQNIVMFSNPDAVREVFADGGDAMHAGEASRFLAPFVGEKSVLLLDGKEHMRQRKLLLPPFHGERMQAYGQTMIDLTRASIRGWPLGEPFALHPKMQDITLRVIVRTVFGIGEGAFFDELVERLTELLDLATWPPLLFPLFQKDLGRFSPWGRYLRKSAHVDKMLLGEIRARRRAIAGLTPGAARSDILSMLLMARDEDGAPMADDEIRDELVTLLVAGHETTATTLAWAFRWLLDTPGEKERLLAELAGVASAGALAPDRVAKLERLDAVVRETLRLQPVIPLVARILKRPARVGGHDLPAGAAVACSIYLAQRRPDLYPSPAEFRPDRFIGKKFTPNEFFPFGGGVRRCVGMAFAMHEMKMVIATVLSHADIALAPGARPKVSRRGPTLAPSNGTRVVCRRADR